MVQPQVVADRNPVEALVLLGPDQAPHLVILFQDALHEQTIQGKALQCLLGAIKIRGDTAGIRRNGNDGRSFPIHDERVTALGGSVQEALC